MQATGLELGEQVVGHDHRAAGSVDEQSAVAHAREEVAVDHVARLLGQGEDQHDDVGVRQQVRHLRQSREHRRARGARPASARRRRRVGGVRSAGRGRRRRSRARACPEARRSCDGPTRGGPGRGRRPGNSRRLARMAVSTHSEVAPPWTPRASHRITPSGISPISLSTPALSAWTTRSRGITCAAAAGEKPSAGTRNSVRSIPSGGAPDPSQVSTSTPSGIGLVRRTASASGRQIVGTP